MTQVAELEPRLDAILTSVVKIGTETDSLVTMVAELRAELEQGGVVPPAVEAKLAAVEAQVKVVDDKVTDITPPPPPAG